MHQGIVDKKMDICFANSLIAVKKAYRFTLFLHALQCCTMVCMLPLSLYVFKNEEEEVLSFFILGVIVTSITFLSKLGHLTCILSDKQLIMNLAEELQHTVSQESIDISSNSFPADFISQKVYNAQTEIGPQDATPQIRAIAQAGTTNMIRSLAMSRDNFNRCLITIMAGISFGLFIYGIIVLIKYPMNWVEVLVIIIFLIAEFLIQIQVFACLILVALSPLFCFCCCVYVCLFKDPERQARLPEAAQASIQIIQKADGDGCSICMQDISLGEEVIVLPCSPKHIFHENCIKAWANAGSTCPVCRYDLSG